MAIRPQNFGIHLRNENDFSNMMVKIVNTVKMPIVNLITKAVNKYIQSVFDLLAKVIPHPINLGKGIKLNMDYLELPNIENAVSVQRFNATFFNDGQVRPWWNNQTIPLYDSEN